MKERGAVFRQSLLDFPCSVELGKNNPSFGINRWAGNGGLRFVPPDDEGFTLRGDKRRLVYKGRRRSHRFTILGDNAFEYDCILLKEPESNVISLVMEGAENFDFFQQPDFVAEPLLKGSYAVYKKDTLLGEGTGKLCHIHRPEIIDARGRRCWGDLSILGNFLCIAIPEKWLSEAAYPVVVDPTIGTSTIGSQTMFINDDGDRVQLFIEDSLAVNRFLISEALNTTATATAYVYAFDTDYYGRCKPVIYTDNNNVPQLRRSSSEGEFDIAVKSGKPAGWRSTTFKTNSNITSGNYVWFGLFCDFFAPRFDFGQKCYRDFWDSVGTDIPNTYPVYDKNSYYDFKLSMYFTYTAAQNYVRVLTQGVDLSDSRKLKSEYRRNAVQTTAVNSSLSRFETFYRNFSDIVKNTMAISRMPVFNRKCQEIVSHSDITNRLPLFARKLIETLNSTETKEETMSISRKVDDTVKAGIEAKRIHSGFREVKDDVKVNTVLSRFETFYRKLIETLYNSMSLNRLQSLIRNIAEQIQVTMVKWESRIVARKCVDDVNVNSSTKRVLNIFRKIKDGLQGLDTNNATILYIRTLNDNAKTFDKNSHWGNFIRGLLVTAGNTAETVHKAEYYRYHADTVQVDGKTSRGLLLFVRIVSQIFVRDFLLRRFLVAREELVLKSCITRELIIDSKIN